MRSAPIALALALAAGCDDSIDVHLLAPPGETTTRIDYGCVNRIQAIAYGSDDTDFTESCEAVPAGGVRNLRDHDLAGLMSLGLPRTGLRHLLVRGVRSDDDLCDSPGADTIFFGMGAYGGGWDLNVQLNHALDCAEYRSDPTPVQMLSLPNLLGDVPAQRCAPPALVEQYTLALMNQFPLDYGNDLTGYYVERSSDVTNLDTTGRGTITGPHFRLAEQPSCMSLYTPTGPIMPDIGPVATCIDATQAPLCGPAGTAETVFYTATNWGQFAQSTQTLGDDFSDVSIGLVYDAATRAPIAGATASRVGDVDPLGLTYFSYAAGMPTPLPGATATSDDGLFAIELLGPTTVLVSAPGYQSRTVVMSVDFSANTSRLIPLRR